ncbi:hypothetical protein SBA2_10057 [Acidobacteriia bacterium SbA2]|nr:hypothetical protein SBA2_10057 [Acidobacteriia bacterium SbA2]
MATKLRDFSLQPDVLKQRRDHGPQSALGDIFLSSGIPQNISHFFLHAPVMPPGTALQPQLYIRLDVAHDELRHHSLLLIS